MHRLHFKYDYQAAILENQLRAITPELMAGSTPNFNHRYIYIYWGYFTVSSQEVSTMALAISLRRLGWEKAVTFPLIQFQKWQQLDGEY
jgi:hypothetical protein